MLNSSTGEFNMLDASGLLLKPTGGGVRLPTAGSTVGQSAMAVASGASAFVLRSSTLGTQVYLVDQATVAAAVPTAGPTAGPTPGSGAHTQQRASISLTQARLSAPSAAVSANGALWPLTGQETGATIRELQVPAASNAGATLTSNMHGVVSGPAALESIAGGTAAGTAGTTVAPATSNTSPNCSLRTGRAPAGRDPAGLDRIVAATNVSGRLAFSSMRRTAGRW